MSLLTTACFIIATALVNPELVDAEDQVVVLDEVVEEIDTLDSQEIAFDEEILESEAGFEIQD